MNHSCDDVTDCSNIDHASRYLDNYYKMILMMMTSRDHDIAFSSILLRMPIDGLSGDDDTLHFVGAFADAQQGCIAV